ncbi:nuclear transcription factor Y subunit B-1-like [Nymphaea colorata]|uniref:nuclear transcription factor Y subunit B-1-like n=1 Tax=Nymphaea colorata TaxID=210225 RepID=UPI00129D70B7|nr:nuclear transcription factor Y subunit B-1-like [Nymphaea colorata]
MGSPSVGGGSQEGKPPEDVGAAASAAAAERDGCLVREQDRFMPIANVIRIMRRILPSHAKISDDAKETIQECVSEYISFVTSEANERCQREQRKTITADDVLWAMRKLGFDDYVEPLSVYLQKFREMEGERGGMRVVDGLTGSMRKDMGALNGYHSSTHHGMYGGGGGRFYRDGGRGGGAPPAAGGGGSLYRGPV